ncbi:class I SAM-dependent methyltransferase [Aurantibacter sp.]|uniref:class I SAM-dependent methyltransferase n=1 Tax=Aurantibacter sp. TaxID=2807103 RepID=UPI003262E6E1
MNKHILNTDIQNFINENLGSDIMSIVLKKQLFKEVSQKELVQQIESKKKCQKKLPTWFSTEAIYYPKKLNVEQTSSEITAHYKAQIVNGNSLIDLTGGFGVDSYFFSKLFNEVYYCEINAELAQIAAYNHKILGAKNIQSIPKDGISFLCDKTKKFDCIYLDPSRRNDVKGKVFQFADCGPNVVLHLDFLFDKSETVLIKSSPLHDLSYGIKELKNVLEIHVVAVNNEVKELLWLLNKNYNESILIKTVNIKKDENQSFEFNYYDEVNALTDLSLPLNYLYEPNAAILKSGAFKLVSKRLNVKKLQEHSHLYTSEYLLDFPGRRFLINKIIPYNKAALKSLNLNKANISIRNFPESVAQIRKKHNIKDGGKVYLFFTRNMENEKIILKCAKIDAL